MSSVVHRLGELEHFYDKHNLKLKTNRCITFSSIQSSDFLFSSHIQDLEALISLISSGTWTAGANRLLFHVELLFDDISVSGCSVSQVTEEIGVAICKAELWSQLCLDASLTVDDSKVFYISLSAQLSSSADVNPPRWTPTACIESIGLSFHFSTGRRTRIALSAPLALSVKGIQHTRTSRENVDDHLDHGYHSPLSSLGRSQDTIRDNCTSSVDASLMNHHNTVMPYLHKSTPNTPPTRYKYITQEVRHEILVQMVDSSIRRMISDSKSVRPGGIVLASDPGYPKLAAISPALFSPGYLKAVSQRTALLPTIARIVSRVHRRTNTSGPNDKFKRLQEGLIINYFDCDPTVDSDSNSVMLSSCVEARLWLLARSKLIDPLACRALKPLSSFTGSGFLSQEILDESLDGAEDVMLDDDEPREPLAHGDLDPAYHVDLFQEHFSDETSDEEDDLLDDDSLREHPQDEVAYDSIGSLSLFCP